MISFILSLAVLITGYCIYGKDSEAPVGSEAKGIAIKKAI